MSRRLHEIAGDFLALEELLMESGGEVTEEIETWMAENTLSLETKVDGYAALIAEWTADAEKWKTEAQRNSAHAKTLENSADKLKGRLVEQLVALDRLKVETDRFKVAVQRSAGKVELLVNADQLPAEYLTTTTTTAVNKAAIKQGLVDGIESLVGLAQMTEGTAFLRIR